MAKQRPPRVVRPAIHVLNARDAIAADLSQGLMNRLDDVGLGRGRHHAVDEAHGVISKNPGGLAAVALSVHDPTRRVLGSSRNRCQGHSPRIGDGHVSVVAAKIDGPLSYISVKQLGVR